MIIVVLTTLLPTGLVQGIALMVILFVYGLSIYLYQPYRVNWVGASREDSDLENKLQLVLTGNEILMVAGIMFFGNGTDDTDISVATAVLIMIYFSGALYILYILFRILRRMGLISSAPDEHHKVVKSVELANIYS